MIEPLRLGFWGGGAWAGHLASRASALGELSIAACWDVDAGAAQLFAKRFDCTAAPSEDAFLGQSCLDAVVITTPNDLHPAHAIAAAQRGLHLFVEKPIANSAAEAKAIVSAAQESGVVLMTGHNTRREARFRRARVLMEEGALGEVVAANLAFTSHGGLLQPAGSWRMDPLRCRSLALSQLGVHSIDTLSFLFGRPTSVHATVRSVALPSGLEDSCVGVFSHGPDITSSFQTCYSVVNTRSLTILGTKAAYTSDPWRTTLRTIGEPQREQVLETAQWDTVALEFAEFARCCRTGAKPETDGLAGLEAVVVLEAILQANGEGRRISIDWTSLGKAAAR